jgi:hypothetical protein
MYSQMQLDFSTPEQEFKEFQGMMGGEADYVNCHIWEARAVRAVCLYVLKSRSTMYVIDLLKAELEYWQKFVG